MTRALCCVLFLAVAAPAVAQEQEGIALGQLRILPTIGITYGHDDNVAYTNGQQVESYFYMISPGIRLELPSDRSILSLTWSAAVGRYETSEIDDYENQVWSLDWQWDPNARNHFSVSASWREGHQKRGEGARQGDLALLEIAPDEWRRKSIGASWRYGAAGSRGRLGIEVSRTMLDYTNNPLFTRGRDFDTSHLGADFFWRVAPKTSLGVGARWDEYEYVSSDFSGYLLDSRSRDYFLGLNWDVSARTNGRIEYGRHRKRFEDPHLVGYKGNFWRASIDWRPRTYSTLVLSTSKGTEETDGYGGDYTLVRDLSLGWSHAWATRFSTHVELGWHDTEYRPNGHQADGFWWGISGRWQFNRYLQLGAGWKYYERDSDDSEFFYEKNVWVLTLEGSL